MRRWENLIFGFNPVFCIIAIHRYGVHWTNNPFFYLSYTFKLMMVFRKFHKIKYGRFCHYLTPVILIEHLLSISQTRYNKFYMKISVSECTFSDSSLNSPALSFKSIRCSSIWIIRNWANVRNWANDCSFDTNIIQSEYALLFPFSIFIIHKRSNPLLLKLLCIKQVDYILFYNICRNVL